MPFQIKQLFLLTGKITFLCAISSFNLNFCQDVDDLSTPIEDAAVSLGENETPLYLDLPTAINIAISNNRTLANALDTVQRSQLNLDLSMSTFDLKIIPSADVGFIGGGTAGLGGAIGGSIEICKKFTYGTRVSFRPYATRDAHHYHSGLQAKIIQPLLKGFGKEYTLAPVYAAQFSYRSSFRAAYISGVDMIIRLINSMYTVIRMESLLELDVEAINRLKRFYNAIKVKERIGMADSLDVYRTETEISSHEDNINNSREQLLDAKDRVREILAIPLSREIVIQLPIDYSPFEIDINEAVDSALLNRIEIEQANDRWEESRRLSRLAKTNLLPDLDIALDFSNIGRDEIFTRTFTNERDSRWGVGFITSTDWDRTAQQVAFQQSLFGIVNAERGLNQTQDNIILEVKRTIRSLHRAGQKISLQLTQIHQSEGGLKLAKLKFDRGLANNFDVIQAEKTLRNSLAAYQSALIEHKIGEYRFLAAVGLLVDKPKICP